MGERNQCKTGYLLTALTPLFAVAVALHLLALLALLATNWMAGRPVQAASAVSSTSPNTTSALNTSTSSTPANPSPSPTPLPPTPIPPTATQAPAMVVAGVDGVNVRTGPGTDFTRIGYLAPGAQAVVIGRDGDWWQIEYEGAPAWVFGGIVTASNVDDVPQAQVPLQPTPIPSSPAVIPAPAAPSAIQETRWIDIDLSEQSLTAYENGEPVHTTLVSTGLPATPTPVGQFRIWIKLHYDDMAGADYYIEDVPFVMYFYQGYGLHGVTWHGNFGHPMSHGCINLPTAEAEWLFNWADVGTLVNIHE
jgi:lipoprotein-anchoring transpeptidase ErfK/SrfK